MHLNDNEIIIITWLKKFDFNPSVETYSKLIESFQHSIITQHFIFGFFSSTLKSPGFDWHESRCLSLRGLKKACKLIKNKNSLDDFTYGYNLNGWSRRKILVGWVKKIDTKLYDIKIKWESGVPLPYERLESSNQYPENTNDEEEEQPGHPSHPDYSQENDNDENDDSDFKQEFDDATTYNEED